ncbi:hypothetical protein [Acuticoccus sediminis]|uniref:hypothetical protein n=1 Tax=Acuticoccus sediminis TaxID=2184697 RepID=UPI000DAF13C1|nr:hypothetical protein [Acuticoccus sediminis]
MLLLTALCAVILPATEASAHIKWFYPYDLTQAPRDIGQVLQSNFVILYIASAVAIYVFFVVDRTLYRTGFLRAPLSRLMISEDQAYWIIRICVSVMFLALFLYGLFSEAMYLTPELKTANPLVKWVQLAIAAVVWFRPTVPLAAIGMIGLYFMAGQDYGYYHMMDYPLFLGLAVFLLFSTMKGDGWMTLRYVALFATTGISLLWGAVEKFAYPNWFYPLLDDLPFLTFGFPPELFVMLAGFVEFNLTFVLLSSASIVSRLVAFAFNMIFLLAIYIFGLIDAVGHLMIIAVLLVLTIRGPTKAREFLVLSDRSRWTEAYFMTGLWMLAMNVIFIAYYGLYALMLGPEAAAAVPPPAN